MIVGRGTYGSMANELARGGTATVEMRALIAKGAQLFCRREHDTQLALGLARDGVPCCPHCVLYPAGGGARG